MSSENDKLDIDIIDDDVDIEDSSDDDDVDLDEDNIGDLSVEINVEELVAKLEASDVEDAARRRAIRRRLEELRELKEADLDSTYNINLDDDD